MDMAGNVWEWVNDWYAADYYAVSPVHYPIGPDTGDKKVLRGGSWREGPDIIRSANRGGNPADARVGSVGFRCVVEPGN
jgi:sulfatase modifying factor 1